MLPPLPVPTVIAAPVLAPNDKQLSPEQAKTLRAALRAALPNGDDCLGLEDRAEGESAPPEITRRRLSAGKLLVSTLCWRAAYNVGIGYWIVDDVAGARPIVVTTLGSDYGDGRIRSAQKSRGLGDCWSSDEWTWTGKAFMHTESATPQAAPGRCRRL